MSTSFRRENNIVFLETESGNAAQRLGALNNELASFQSEYQLLQMLTFEEALHREGRDPLLVAAAPKPSRPLQAPTRISSGGAQTVLEPISPEYGKARQQLILLQAEHGGPGTILSPSSSAFVSGCSEEIERTERILAIYREQNIRQLEDRKDALVLADPKHGTATWQRGRRNPSRSAGRWRITTGLQSARERVKLRYDSLLGMMQTISVNKNISQESVTVMEPASAPVPQQASLPRSLALAGLIGLGLGVGAIKLLDRLDDRISSHTEVQQHFDEIILGQIPRIKAPQRGREGALLKPNDDRHAFVEAYRNLRSSLRFMTNGAPMPKLVLVTSSVPNDGKSITALNLAITMAQAGSRVYCSSTPISARHSASGLSKCRAQTRPVRGARRIARIGPDGDPVHLHALKISRSCRVARRRKAAANCSCNRAPRRSWRNSSPTTIACLVDTPPVMAADDVTSLAPHTKGLLFVLRADHTSARVARAALHSLYHRNVHVLGLVFNAVRTSIGENYYYYQYSDYYQKLSQSLSQLAELVGGDQ
jgi:polysaccharide biosynthesis transport protein